MKYVNYQSPIYEYYTAVDSRFCLKNGSRSFSREIGFINFFQLSRRKTQLFL